MEHFTILGLKPVEVHPSLQSTARREEKRLAHITSSLDEVSANQVNLTVSQHHLITAYRMNQQAPLIYMVIRIPPQHTYYKVVHPILTSRHLRILLLTQSPSHRVVCLSPIIQTLVTIMLVAHSLPPHLCTLLCLHRLRLMCRKEQCIVVKSCPRKSLSKRERQQRGRESAKKRRERSVV